MRRHSPSAQRGSCHRFGQRDRASAIRSALALLAGAVLWGSSLASPSAFPETALAVHGGYGSDVTLGLGVEVVLPVPFLDVSAGAEVALDLAGGFGARLSGTGLVFPTVGTTPPLALGLGADLTYRDGAVGAHLGLVTGFDLLYVSELPAVISAYLAPGYTFADGFSLAWSVEARYYADAVAVVIASSDLIPVSLGLRVPF